MRYLSYVVARDFGFAPNPFFNSCTLATCKPKIRTAAEKGDWIFGTGSVALGCQNKLIFAMEVTNKITYNQYWATPEYKDKKPTMIGSLMQMYGDNIYYTNGKEWHQSDSHHSYANGVINEDNLNRDTSSKFVLISTNYYYFGENCIDIPQNLLSEVCLNGRGFKYVESKESLELIKYLKDNYNTGYNGNPIQFKEFQRHDGKYS